MLTIAEVSGLIAAVVVIVQYILPASIAIVLVRSVGTENTAVTWSVVHRYVSNTIWPHILRADAVSSHHLSTSTTFLTWTSTTGAALLVLASVLAPLGLYEQILPGEAQLVEFRYARDPTPWGDVTMPRPNMKFTRRCEVGRAINCPGQYQGVYMKEVEPGKLVSVETDENSTINSTIPRNYTTMFRSATSDQGNTISGMFDIQFRRWGITRVGIVDKGQPYARGESRHIESLIQQDNILLKEGLIINMKDNPGIGFRNHTIPIGLEFGGLWNEDITWIEPVTQCADTNLSAELRTEISGGSFIPNRTQSLIDRGAFLNLQNSDLEARPWIDNQTLDLFSHAQKAARMHNVLVASSFDVLLPLKASTRTLPPRPVGTEVFSFINFDQMQLSKIKGIGGKVPLIPEYDFKNISGSAGNSSTTPTGSFIPRYPDGMVKLLALNHSAIQQICEGHYRVSDLGTDERAVNITYPAVRCGVMYSAPTQRGKQSLSASTWDGVTTSRKNIYICATAYKASIKSVDFRYNATRGDLSGLEVLKIAPKVYSAEASKPLWAVEHSFDRVMRFDPLWGLVNDSYETTEGFHTLRSESLWLPTSPSMSGGFGESEGYDALAAAGGFLKRLANLYDTSKLDGKDYTGETEWALSERWQRLSENQLTASQIPSLILTEGLAASLVGTKTSFATKYVEWPASLAVDSSERGYPRARVRVQRRVIQYDIRYAIPSFVVLTILLAAVSVAVGYAIVAPAVLQTMQQMYNQTSAGRLATALLRPEKSNPSQTSDAWVKNEGGLVLAFGKIRQPEDDSFCKVVGESLESESQVRSISEATKSERGHLLPGNSQETAS